MEWWVTKGDRKPVGPASTELVIQGIEAGMIPGDALVCEVGGTAWKPLRDVSAFSIAMDEQRGKRRFDPNSERTIVDPPLVDDVLTKFDDVVEHTVAERNRLSEPPRRQWLESISDGDDSTAVDHAAFRPSEPPSKT